MICRYLPAAERKIAWEAVNGPIPVDMRLAHTCEVAYCWKLEHMVLVKNRNFGNVNYVQYRERINALAIDEYFEILDVPANDAALRKLRCGLLHAAGLWKITMRSMPNGGVRIYKTGQWGSAFAGVEGFESHKGILLMNTKNRMTRPACLFLGFMARSNSDDDFHRVQLCDWRGCVYPVVKDHRCRMHLHWFDYPESMTDRSLDVGKFWSPREPHAPFELVNDVRPPATWALEKSLKFISNAGVRDDRHRSSTERPVKPIVENYSRSTGTSGGLGSGRHHTSSKTSAGRHRRSSHSGKGRHDPNAPKKWTRETLEAAADELLGITPEMKIAAEEMRIEQGRRLSANRAHWPLAKNYSILEENLTEEEERMSIASTLQLEDFEEAFRVDSE